MAALSASRNMSLARATRQAAPARVAARQVVRASRRNAVVVNAAARLVGLPAPGFKATAGEQSLSVKHVLNGLGLPATIAE